ncbi:uncharacterized protein LOC119670963 [Teleopsis dalmanni]|uniref:uncharacterized protein LOC119670963 n=1 Tax=Teleopsis dalmanni TaxID=139649 RepID=UPI0018CDA0BF|nr:uncharacterized protein LOC119670963 [Teleopsis dalmanni]
MLFFILIAIVFGSNAQMIIDQIPEGSYLYPGPVYVNQPIQVKAADVITKDDSMEPKPVLYHFITDYPHPAIPNNNYIKPGQLVANKAVESPLIFIKNYAKEPGLEIKQKKNILYAAVPVLNTVPSEENK